MGLERAGVAALGVLMVAALLAVSPSDAQGLPDYTPQGFVDLYDSVDLPNTSPITVAPPITGDSAADNRIRSLAESRGYRLRTQAGGGLVGVEGHLVQPAVAGAWGQMRDAAAGAGVSLTLTSAYRSVGDQRSILLGRLSGWSNAQIASGAADGAILEALRLVSVPGYSKHHSGYAIDVVQGGGGLEGFERTAAYAWLSADNFANAKRFGFIPSYPYGAAPFGPDPEPWELVWVGVDNIVAGGDRSPVGWFDAAFFDAAGATLVGWALDYDGPGPIGVHVYANGAYIGSMRADVPRPDVASALGVGPDHGFNGRFGLPLGHHRICTYAINSGTAPHTELGCIEGDVADASPVGWFDAAFFEPGGVTIVGWALDRDTFGRQDIHIYVDGAYAKSTVADVVRSDVAAALGVAPEHGFNTQVALTPGSHEVCVYALSRGAAPHTALGCMTGVS